MKNTYVCCKDWSWEDKLLYIKACIGEDMPHESFCGHAVNGKNELLNTYRFEAGYIYYRDTEMLSFDRASTNPFVGKLKEVGIESLRAAELEEKPKRVRVDLKLPNYATVSSAIKAHEDGVKFVRLLPDGDTEDLSWFGLCECYAKGLKVMIEEETEISERDEFIEAAYKSMIGIERAMDVCEEHLGAMFDSGKFKLVD